MIILNGKEMECPLPCTVQKLLEWKGFSCNRVAVEQNGEIVPKSRYAETQLCDGDRIEVVSFVGGG